MYPDLSGGIHFLTFAQPQPALHNRMQLFLSSCAQADNADDIDQSLLDFSELIRCIMTGDFVPVALPPVIEQAALKSLPPSPEKKREPDSDTNDESPPGKRSKKKPNEQLTPAINNKQVADWKVSTHQFKKFHEHRETLPQVGDDMICLKFQLLGSCNLGRQCKRLHTELKGQDKINFQQWFDATKNQE